MIDKKNTTSSREEEVISLLESIIENKNGNKFERNSFVLALTSQYGGGKTTFAKSLQEKIKQKYTVCYIDAWKHSYLPPLVHLLKVLNKLFFNEKNNDTEIFKKVISLISINVAAIGIDLSKIFEEKDPIEEFHQLIAEKATNKPIIFLLDELDRCKASYTKEYLINIHHFFDIKNCVFILFLEPNYLNNLTLGKKGKIEKFVDMRIPLYSQIKLEEEIRVKNYLSGVMNLNTEDIAEIISIYSPSFRDLTQIKVSMDFLQTTYTDIFLKENNNLLFFILLFRHCNPLLFDQIFDPVKHNDIIKKLDEDIHMDQVFSKHIYEVSYATEYLASKTEKGQLDKIMRSINETDKFINKKSFLQEFNTKELENQIKQQLHHLTQNNNFDLYLQVHPKYGRYSLQYLTWRFRNIICFIHDEFNRIPPKDVDELEIISDESFNKLPPKNGNEWERRQKVFWRNFIHLIYNFSKSN